MSRFCDVMYENARTSTRGMVTSAVGWLVRVTWKVTVVPAGVVTGGPA